MASLKALAGQTIWYGGSNIAAKFLNYLLTPLLTYLMADASGLRHYGELTVLYAAISFANVVFTYGLETAYFRFSHREGVDRRALFETSFASLIGSTVILGLALWLLRRPIAGFFGLEAFPVYISWCIGIIAFDTLAALPFARLRQESRPRRYAFVKVAGILVNILLTLWAIGYGPRYAAAHPDGWYARWAGQYSATGLLLLANLAASASTFLLLAPEWKGFRWRVDARLWGTVLSYALPFVIIGLGGMVNETLDRILLQKLLPGGEEAAKQTVAIYSANYKLAIFITLFIQAFRMAAEPFFFRESAGKDAPQTYARVMKWFVITLCLAFLGTVLFLDIWKYLVGPSYRGGLGVVPILLLANIALGIYYNLSVWYKITGRLGWGTAITLGGAALTLVLNIAFIPTYGIWASAWATLACYGSMMVVSYLAGQKYFPVPYRAGRLAIYIGSAVGLYALHRLSGALLPDIAALRLAAGMVFLLLFLFLVGRKERAELKRFPVIGKWIR